MKKFLALFLSVAIMFTLLPTIVLGGENFPDMPDNWSTEALQYALDHGLLKGMEDGTLQPQSNLTRSQLAAIMVRLMGATVEAELDEFSDVPSDEWYAQDMAKAVSMRLYKGSYGKLYPEDYITRQEVFTVLARAFMLPDGTASDVSQYNDSADIHPTMVPFVAALTKAGYIKGNFGGIHPQDNITRAEFAQVIFNMVQQILSDKATISSVAEGNIVVNVPGIILSGITINGDLIIGEGVGKGDVTLKNVTVEGRVIVRGGGSDRGVKLLNNTNVKQLLSACVDDRLWIYLEKPAIIAQLDVYATSPVATIIQGSPSKVNLVGDDLNVIFVTSETKFINISGSNNTAESDSGSLLGTITVDKSANNTIIKGAARLENLNINGNNTELLQMVGVNVKVDKDVTGTKILGKEVEGGASGFSLAAGGLGQIKPVTNGGGSPPRDYSSVPSSVTFNINKATLAVGDTVDLIGTVMPNDAVSKILTWSSDNKDVATVKYKETTIGTVTAVKLGEATITGMTHNQKFDKCVINVVPQTILTDISLLQETINNAADAEIIKLPAGEYTLDTQILANKNVVIKGASEGTTINVSGSLTSFVLENGASLSGLTIKKTDSVDQNIISMDTDTSVFNCNISGMYANGDTEMVRGIKQVAGSDAITISGNTFEALTQPAYLEGTGKFSDNTVTGTQGLILCVDHLTAVVDNTFTGNSSDITITANGKSPGNPLYEYNYDGLEVNAMSAANGDCRVSNQYTAYNSGDGISNISKLQPAIDAAAPGATIVILPGEYALSTTINVNKNVTVKGGAGVIITTSGSASAFVLSNGGKLYDCTIKKTDTAAQDIIKMESGTTVSKSYIEGKSSTGAANVRGIRQTAGSADVIVEGTYFINIITPIYMEGAGNVTGNSINNCGPITLCVDHVTAVTGNWFNECATDIVISANGKSAGNTTYINNYNNAKVEQISADNQGAKVVNEYTGYTPVQTEVTSIEQLRLAIQEASSGAVIKLAAGTYSLSTPLNIDKNVTIIGKTGAIINVTGTSNAFVLSNGAALDNLTIKKIDDMVSQDIISMNTGTSVRNCDIQGLFNIGDSEMSRAIRQVQGSTGLVIDNNNFAHLNEPVFMNGTGNVTNNFISYSNGFKAAVTNIAVFTGNEFSNNVTDITIIANGAVAGNPTYTANYSNAAMAQMSLANNGAIVVNEYTGYPPMQGGVSNITELQQAINEADPGSIITLMAGAYSLASPTAPINVNKMVTVKGQIGTVINTSGNTPAFILSNGGAIDGLTIIKTDKLQQNIVEANTSTAVRNCTISGQYQSGDAGVQIGIRQIADATGVTISGNKFKNLSHPAYLEGTGSFTGNQVDATAGLIVCVNHIATITGNQFSNNPVDVKIIANGKAQGNQTYIDNYSDAKVESISIANNCYVINEYTGFAINRGGSIIANINNLQDAIDAASVGAVLTIGPGNHTIDNPPIRVNKNVTIKMSQGAVIHVHGSTPVFELTNGGKIDGLVFDKFDKSEQDIVHAFTGASITDCVFKGIYAKGELELSRAIYVGTDQTNVTIMGNSISKFNHAMYLNGTATVANNTITATNGIVLTVDHVVRPIGNVFISNTADMLIVDNGQPKGQQELIANYSNTVMDTISKDNGDCSMINYYTGNTIEAQPIVIKDITQLQAAIDMSANGDVIKLDGKAFTLTVPINLYKPIKILGLDGAVISVSGNLTAFTVTNGGSIENIDFIKTDKLTQDIVSINNGTIKSCGFTGQYINGDAEAGGISRGIRQVAGSANLVIDECTFNKLREPMYIEGTGTVSNNTVTNSTGIKVCVNYVAAITGNTFSSNTPYDIHILANNMPKGDPVLANNYNEAALSGANRGANVHNDYDGRPQPNRVVSKVADLQAEINAADPGDIIQITEVEGWITGTAIEVNKAVTITAADGTVIKTFGGASVFNLSNGAILDGLTIEKVDDLSSQNLIVMNSDTVVKNCKMSGMFDSFDDPETTRGIVQIAGSENITIYGNRFERLRQPAYLEGTGQFAGNTVIGTRGCLITVNHLMTFSGNHFEANLLDIVIISNGFAAGDAILEGNYNVSKMLQMSEDNGDARIQNQYIGYDTVDGVTNLDSLQAVIASVPEGAVITVAANEYDFSGMVHVNRKVTVKAAPGVVIKTTGTDPVFVVTNGGTVDGFHIMKVDNDVDQSLIIVGNNATVKNCNLSALFDDGDSEMTRGIIQQRGTTNIKISGNVFNHLRQAAMFEGSGLVENNHVSATEGFVVAVDFIMNFSGNVFAQNKYDIHIVANGNAMGNPVLADNYNDSVIAQMKAANNNANIVNDYLSMPRFTVTDISTLQDVINAAPLNSLISIVGGDHYLADTIEIHKNVTVRGEQNTTVNVAGNKPVFSLKDGGVLYSLNIVKIDNLEQNIIIMNTGSTLRKCSITGKYTPGDGVMTRGVLQMPGTTGIMVADNTFTNLNQAGYFEGTGTIQDNTCNQTNGFTACVSYVMAIANNVFNNSVSNDITIAKGAAADNDPQCFKNYDITKVDQLSEINKNPDEENEYAKVVNAYMGYRAHEGLSDISNLQAYIDAASEGSTIYIADGVYYLSNTTINIYKGITLKAKSQNTVINVSGSATSFNLTQAAILDGFTINKVDDRVSQNIITMGSDTQVRNNIITGKYEMGDDEVSRGIITGAGVTGITIDNNIFTALRQPAYIEGEGICANNTVTGTRGFAVCVNYFTDFFGNQFSGNMIDISIIPNNQQAGIQEYLDNYSLSVMDDFKTANNNCTIENLYLDYVNTTYVSDYTQLQTAIADAEDGNAVCLTEGKYYLPADTSFKVDKPIIIKGEVGTEIYSMGSTPVFELSNGASIDGVSFVKLEDNVNQNMLSLTGNNVTVKNCTFTAKFKDGDGEVTRGIVMNAGTTGFVIEGNTFVDMRQPAYIEGTGTVKDNLVSGTRGFVVCVNYAVSFIGNQFSNNAVDIAIIPNNMLPDDPVCLANYSNGVIDQMVVDNPGAMIDNQYTGYKRNIQ